MGELQPGRLDRNRLATPVDDVYGFPQRPLKTPVISLSRAGDAERSSVVNRTPHNWQANADGIAVCEVMHLDGDMALVMVEGQDEIELPLNSAIEDGVGRVGA